MKLRYLLALLPWLLMPALVHAASVQATLNRSTVQLGETVTLNLRINDYDGNLPAPDLSALNQDFSILGTSQNRSLSIINGRRTSELTLGVALRPRHTGTLEIPALTLAGMQTTPLQLQVDPPDPNAARAAQGDVFMEAQVEPGQAYVGQQLSYVVRLYYAVDLTGGSLDTPQIDGVQVSRIGDDLNYDAQRGGRAYHVLERRFALIPQRAGHIEIPPLGFQGDVVDPRDPNSFFGASTPVSASAPGASVEVKAAPADWGKSAWLPARDLSLTLSGWPDSADQVRVGQPLNLRMKLQATGIPFEALPELSLPPIDGATVYPDKPVTGTDNDGRWLKGHREQAFAVVPTRAGTLTLPATTLKWWNVQTNTEEVARIPAHSVTVLPATGAASAAAMPPAASAAAPAAVSPPVPAAAGAAPWWRWLALASIGLWLLSALGWLLWRWRRRRASTAVPSAVAADSTRQLRLAFLAAARGSDSAAQVRSLLAWARAERPSLRNLGDLAAALADEAQRRAIEHLQQRHYAGVARGEDDLAAVFNRGFVWRASGAAPGDQDLPPLYPFNLH
ncbi:MAG: BatD family protein [Rhodanobacter sp.]